MKGSIGEGLQMMVQKKFGKEQWEKILVKSGQPKNFMMFSHHDIDDNVILTLIKNSCEVLGITMSQASDAFGEFWIHEYAKTKYFAFFRRDKSAKEFIMNMDRVHTKLTETVPNAKPPSFTYEEIDARTITMTYSSPRNLQEMWIGLIKGVASYFNETVKIERINTNKVKLTFN